MNQKTFNEILIAVILIGFAVMIVQNQLILNRLSPEQPAEDNPINRLMALPEMQEFKNYQGVAEYLPLANVTQLAEQYPDIYGNITTDIYRVELYGEKTILVLYDYMQNKVLRMFEMMEAEVGQ